MSRQNDHYEQSPWHRFVQWVNGEYDPIAGRLETKVVKAEKTSLNAAPEDEQAKAAYDKRLTKRLTEIDFWFKMTGGVFCIFMTIFMLWSVSAMPAFGDPASPVNNEVSARYIEKGIEETGAVNIVTGMILDYRAFDTFGESCVLFIASCCVLILLRVDEDEDPSSKALEEMYDRAHEPVNDLILQKCADVLVPIIILFGIYVVLNGHLSPGGGFSGGAIIGAGLILYLTAYGYEKTQRFINAKVCKVLTVCALSFYCFAKSYSFYTGANHLHSIISTGTPGRIISSGLILPLNICVGIVVACTMYSFYSLFRKGGI